MVKDPVLETMRSNMTVAGLWMSFPVKTRPLSVRIVSVPLGGKRLEKRVAHRLGSGSGDQLSEHQNRGVVVSGDHRQRSTVGDAYASHHVELP